MTDETLTLTFSLLDQIESAYSSNRSRVEAMMPRIQFNELGPAIAFLRLHHYQDPGNLLSMNQSASTQAYLKLRKTSIFENMLANSSWEPLPAEFCWVPAEELEIDYRWEMFRQRFRKAAEAAGFSSRIANALAGAFGEMTSNAQEHSQSIETAIAGYAWSGGRFEYCVSDWGIGVLSSLRSCGHFGNVTSHAEALAATDIQAS